jgi:hypothetical protein
MSKTFEMKDLNVNHKNGGRKMQNTNDKNKPVEKVYKLRNENLEYFDDYTTTKVGCSSLV